MRSVRGEGNITCFKLLQHGSVRIDGAEGILKITLPGIGRSTVLSMYRGTPDLNGYL